MTSTFASLSEILLLLGGIYHLAIAIFHLFFWRLFNWKEELALLSKINQGVMQILNLRLTYLFFFFAYISIFHPYEMVVIPLGRALLIALSLFWFFRTVEQVIFFGIRSRLSLAFVLIFFLGSILYVSPLFVR